MCVDGIQHCYQLRRLDLSFNQLPLSNDNNNSKGTSGIVLLLKKLRTTLLEELYLNHNLYLDLRSTEDDEDEEEDEDDEVLAVTFPSLHILEARFLSSFFLSFHSLASQRL